MEKILKIRRIEVLHVDPELPLWIDTQWDINETLGRDPLLLRQETSTTFP